MYCIEIIAFWRISLNRLYFTSLQTRVRFRIYTDAFCWWCRCAYGADTWFVWDKAFEIDIKTECNPLTCCRTRRHGTRTGTSIQYRTYGTDQTHLLRPAPAVGYEWPIHCKQAKFRHSRFAQDHHPSIPEQRTVIILIVTINNEPFVEEVSAFGADKGQLNSHRSVCHLVS